MTGRLKRPRAASYAVGRRILDARSRRGWSQARLARRVSLDQSMIARIETGDRRVTVDDLVELAEALGVTPAALLP